MKKFFTVIGGMGTIATESYLRLINHRLPIAKDQDYLDYILVNHASVPDRTSYILDHSKPSFLPDLLEDVQQQSLLSPEFMVIVCNTAHYFYEDLQAATSVPILHMPRIATNQLKEKYPATTKVGLIATRGTIADEIYKDEIHRIGKEVVLGGPEIQPMVDELIYDNIKEKGTVDAELYHSILQRMHDVYDVDVVVLGCTELSLAQELAPDHPYNVIDAQNIIADVTIEAATAIRAGKDTEQVLAKYLN